MFIFLLQMGVWFAITAGIPIGCNADMDTCRFFDSTVFNGKNIINTWGDSVREGQYKSVLVESNVFMEAYSLVTGALSLLVSVLWGAIAGVFGFVIFIFGSNLTALAIAGALQALVYYFYLVLIIKTIKEASGEV